MRVFQVHLSMDYTVDMMEIAVKSPFIGENAEYSQITNRSRATIPSYSTSLSVDPRIHANLH